MFLENKYTKTYFKLISKARVRLVPDRSKQGRKLAYFEEHHIIPKALGGRDEAENFVYFTAREHFIAHLLLPKMTEGSAHAKMKFALSKMLMIPKKMQGLRYIPTGRTFEISKRASAEAHRGNKEISTKISVARSGKLASKETRKILSQAQKLSWGNGGRAMSEQHKMSISLCHKGIAKSEDTCLKMKEAWVERRKRKAAGLESRTAYSEQTLQKFKVAAQLREANKQTAVKQFAFGFSI